MDLDFTNPERVMIASPHPVIISGIKDALAPYLAFRVVHAVSEIRAISPNIGKKNIGTLLCAYEFESDALPDGIYLLGRLKRRHPTLKIVVLGNFLPRGPLDAFVKNAGADGLLCQSQLDCMTLVQMLHRVVSGQSTFADSSVPGTDTHVPLHNEVTARANTLSLSELEVLRYHLRGWDDRQIAFRRKRSTKTINNQRNQALRKLSLTDAHPKTKAEALLSLRPWLIG